MFFHNIFNHLQTNQVQRIEIGMNGLLFKKNFYILFSFTIIIFAIIFRGWHLKQIPPGFWLDEAVNANEGIRLFQNREIQLFSEEYHKESLYFYFIGISTKLLGENQPWAARMPSVVFGILGVLGVFLLAKELFDFDVGIFAAFLMAVSFWHTTFSRIAFRAIMVPVVCCFAFYFLIIAIKREKLIYYIFAGIISGIGFYTYFSYEIVPFIIVFSFPFFILAKRQNSTNMFTTYKGLLLYLLVTVLVALPMGLFILENPTIFTLRPSDLSIFNLETPWQRLVLNLWKTLLMFTYKGDINPRHNLPGRPQITLPEGLFLGIGLIILALNLYLGVRKKDWWKVATSILIISLWNGMLLPAIISFEGIPHALRTLGSVVPTYIMAALGLKFILLSLKEHLKFFPSRDLLIKIGLIGILLWIALINFQDYFYTYPSVPEINAAFSVDSVNIGEYLNQLPHDVEKYVLVNPTNSSDSSEEIPFSAQTLFFITSKEYKIKFISLSNNLSEIENKSGKFVIVPLEYDPDLRSILSEEFQFDLEEFFTKDGIYLLSHGQLE